MTLESDSILGGVGAILMLTPIFTVAIRPGGAVLGVIALIGFILVLVALHGLADYYKEDGIFENALYGFIVAMVGVVATAIAAIYVVFYTSIVKDFLYDIYPGWNGKWQSLAGLKPVAPNIIMSDITPGLVGALFSVLAILWIFLIVSAFFNRRSLKTLSTKASVKLFSTAGLLLLIGAVLTIVFIGLVLIWIAVLLIAIAFFLMKPQPQQPTAPAAAPPQTPAPV